VTAEPSRLPTTNVLVQSFNFQIQTQYNNREGGGVWQMSDGAATCKQDKAKVSSLLGRRAHKNWWLNAQSL